MAFSRCGRLQLTILSALLVGWGFETVGAQTNSSSTSKPPSFSDKEILDMLLDGYDNKIRPASLVNGTAQPVRVAVNMHISSISRVDDVNMDYTMQGFFRMRWRDQRLAYDDGGTVEYLVLPEIDRLWKPDIFFHNEKSAHFHNLLVPNVLTRIHPDGSILISVRITMTLACRMNLRFFPMDRQACHIRMESYGYSTKDIDLVWDSAQVEVASDLEIARFRLARVSTEDCASHTKTGRYACLKATFFLDREFSYYLHQVFVPTAMLVMLSWIPAWMDPEVPTARILIGLTSVIFLMTTAAGINAALPPVAYTKAIDVWTGMCVQLAFAALVGSALVNYLGYTDRTRWLQGKQNYNKKTGDPIEINGYLNDEEPPMYVPSPRIAKMDTGARIGLPIIFLIFNAIFWLVIITNNHRPESGKP